MYGMLDIARSSVDMFQRLEEMLPCLRHFWRIYGLVAVAYELRNLNDGRLQLLQVNSRLLNELARVLRCLLRLVEVRVYSLRYLRLARIDPV